jgi:hypothetical protein
MQQTKIMTRIKVDKRSTWNPVDAEHYDAERLGDEIITQGQIVIDETCHRCMRQQKGN